MGWTLYEPCFISFVYRTGIMGYLGVNREMEKWG